MSWNPTLLWCDCDYIKQPLLQLSSLFALFIQSWLNVSHVQTTSHTTVSFGLLQPVSVTYKTVRCINNIVHIPHPSVSLVFWYLQKQSTEPGLFLHSNLALGQVESTAHSSISTIETKRAVRLKPFFTWMRRVYSLGVQYLCSCVRFP